MAPTLTAPGPLDTLEEAFDLLQRAPAAVWLRYLSGVAPLIVGLLWAWNDLSASRGPNDNPVLVALFLVAILVWFYRCRQIFAGRLRNILGLIGGTGNKSRSSWALACFEGVKLLAMPIAALSLLPLAYATAFFRSVTLFGGEGMPARDAAARAWKASGAWQRENWFILAIVNLLVLAVFINVAITVIVAPMLVKMLTGYESIFTQRGAQTLAIQFPIIVALTWLCFDPLLQAVYVVRAFKFDGLRTGEDLLVRLKRLAPALVLIALCGSIGHVSAAEQPTLAREPLNHSIDETLQSGDYAWRNPPAAVETDKKDWFLDTVDRAVALLQKGWKAFRDLCSDVLDWVDRALRPILPASSKTEPGNPSAVRPVFYVIGIALLALAIVLLWKFGPRRKSPLPVAPVAAPAIDLNNDRLLASDLPEAEWLQMADRYASSGDLRLALRALYLGTLALLNHRGFLTIHACKSNRDYERELHRRARDTGLSQIFGLNIRSFEQSWYGFHEVTGDQIRSYRENLGRMRANAA